MKLSDCDSNFSHNVIDLKILKLTSENFASVEFMMFL